MTERFAPTAQARAWLDALQVLLDDALPGPLAPIARRFGSELARDKRNESHETDEDECPWGYWVEVPGLHDDVSILLGVEFDQYEHRVDDETDAFVPAPGCGAVLELGLAMNLEGRWPQSRTRERISRALTKAADVAGIGPVACAAYPNEEPVREGFVHSERPFSGAGYEFLVSYAWLGLRTSIPRGAGPSVLAGAFDRLVGRLGALQELANVADGARFQPKGSLEECLKGWVGEVVAAGHYLREGRGEVSTPLWFSSPYDLDVADTRVEVKTTDAVKRSDGRATFSPREVSQSLLAPYEAALVRIVAEDWRPLKDLCDGRKARLPGRDVPAEHADLVRRFVHGRLAFASALGAHTATLERFAAHLLLSEEVGRVTPRPAPFPEEVAEWVHANDARVTVPFSAWEGGDQDEGDEDEDA